MTPRKVLIACENSGRVRDAFIRHGHDAVSCDLLPSDSNLGNHVQGDVLEIIEWMHSLSCNWDIMIAFPPCTDIYISGASHFAEKRADGRQRKAIEFFLALWNADIPRIAIENPVGIMSGDRQYLRMWYPELYKQAKELPVPQHIQPWQFGEHETKKTCLWLKGLPKLVPTDIIEDPEQRRENLTPSGQNKLGPSPDRWKKRSITYPGIAEAMAVQFGGAAVQTTFNIFNRYTIEYDHLPTSPDKLRQPSVQPHYRMDASGRLDRLSRFFRP